MYFFLTGIVLLASIISLFWLKDQLQSPMLARFAYSGLIARLAVVGTVLAFFGLLMLLSDLVGGQVG